MELSFVDYLNNVDDLLETVYGIDSNIAGVDLIAECHANEDTPEECVEYIAGKYGLISLELECQHV
jgi:hypothetical protein